MHKRIFSFLLAAASLSAFAAYEINFDASTTISNEGKNPPRYLNSIALNGTSFAVNQADDLLLYHDLSASAVFSAQPGAEVTPSMNWNGNYMHGYLYIDYDANGEFDPASELVSYSYLNGTNSLGASVAESVGVGLHPFKLPMLAPGDYRMRYVVDWNYNDPKGRNTSTNKINDNRGAIADATLRIPAGEYEAPDYAVNYPAGTVITHGSRYTESISLTVDGAPVQSLAVSQKADKLLFHDSTSKAFVAFPGKSLKVDFGFSADWMNGYVYIDLDNDGKFNPDSELIAYSHLGGKDSKGQANGGNSLNPPAFSLPADVKPGNYRIRFKVDWDSADPAGSTKADNTILKNGGSITDATLAVVPAPAAPAVVEHNGAFSTSTNADGAITVTATPNSGYVFEGVKLSAGFDLGNLEAVNPAFAANSYVFIAGAENSLTIPASAPAFAATEWVYSCIDAATVPAAGNYDIAFRTPGTFGSLSVNGAALKLASGANDGYARVSDNVTVSPAAPVNVTYSGAEGLKVNFLIDLNNDGAFFNNPEALTNEAATTSVAAGTYSAALPVPATPGVYRARVEIENAQTIDFFINVAPAVAAVRPMALNSLIMAASGAVLPETVTPGSALEIKVTPTLPGFAAESVIVRHGHNLAGPEIINGNPQWRDFEITLPASGRVTVPADVVDGDIEVYALFSELPDGEWTKVWGDEFSGSAMDSSKWGYHPRYGATWNRIIAKTDEGRKQVNVFANGCYNSYAMVTDAEGEDTYNNMITGAIYSEGKFSIKYGKIEARIKTTPHIGNFPAFWMMPATSELRDLGLNGWPQDGEIDIWEQINDQGKAHHTVHTGWTGWKDYLQGGANPWPAPKQNSPANSGNNDMDATLWHVYALEWDSEALRWYVDGVLKFTYENKHYSEAGSKYYIDKVTWPFSKEFYIIVNQSVGLNNGWAKEPDTSFVYHTHFDYVRVYQKKGENGFSSSISGNGDDPDFYVPAMGLPDIESSIECIGAPEVADGPARIFDLNGRCVAPGALRPGIYVEKRGNSARKIIVR